MNQKKAKQLRRILNQFAVKKEIDKPLKDIRVIVGYTFNEKGEEIPQYRDAKVASTWRYPADSYRSIYQRAKKGN